MGKIKKDVKNADLGDMVEEVYHCSDPNSRRRNVYLILAKKEPASLFLKNAFVCIDLESGQEHLKDFTRTMKNTTYKIVG